VKADESYSQDETGNDTQDLLEGVHAGDVINNDDDVRAI